jgi:probable F420-dependent oxidoreductase
VERRIAVKIDIEPNGDSDALDGAAALASQAERGGADGLAYPERSSDPMLHVTLAATATTHVELTTNVVVALARSPMTLASQAWSVQQLSGGRFTLGLGSQVRAHIERRFSMPWSAPLARMADYVGALRAIWGAWATGERLAYDGEFYRHTLMSPMFTPAGSAPPPRVKLAALGPAMVELAARVADGVIIHPFMTEAYLREYVRPALDRGAAGRDRAGWARFEVTGAPFAVTGHTEEELAAGLGALRSRLAFYGSTPAYRRVLETHGWGELGDRLHELSVSRDSGRWAEMARLIPAEMLAKFAATGEPHQVARDLARRYGRVLDRCQVNVIGLSSLAARLEFVALLRAAVASERCLRPSKTAI